MKRIQAIRIRESILKQLFGYAAVYVESAGGSAEDLESSKVMLFPIIKRKRIAEIIEPHFKDYIIPSFFHPVPKEALIRYLIRSWYISVPIVVAAIIFLKLWGLFFFILLGAMTILAVFKHKAAGWHIESQQLSFRFRGIERTTICMKKNKIQSIEIRESYFQRKKGLGSVEALVKSGAGPSGGTIIDLGKKDIDAIYQWFSRNKKQGLP